ncbi:MAG: HupE/UreJ family protein, partial [Nitrospirae bacterium]|nr:HupE/UreJ family protein [Candidatus Troglogloeales bacterium]
VEDQKIEGQIDIALRDLEVAIGLDTNQDGAITWGELRSRHAAISAYVLSRLEIKEEIRPVRLSALSSYFVPLWAKQGKEVVFPIRIIDQQVDNHTDGAYTVIHFEIDCCTDPVSAVTIGYHLFFDLDPQHRGISRVTYRGQTQTALFGPDNFSQRLALGVHTHLQTFISFAGEGIFHIFSGFDHILFLLSLLLPAVLRRQDGQWLGVSSFRPAFWNITKIVTAFTLAHSMTLTLAAIGLIRLPSRWVESSIAVSILIVAMNNIYPVVTARLWGFAFAFGLIHGFGFASVLSDLGLPPGARGLALVGFNLGVEAGQLVIVSLFLPLSFFLRHRFVYRQFVRVAGSIAVILLATIWLVERMFEIKLI